MLRKGIWEILDILSSFKITDCDLDTNHEHESRSVLLREVFLSPPKLSNAIIILSLPSLLMGPIMPALKSVTHVSGTSVTYVSGLYTGRGKGEGEKPLG
jgi:hypothetical protein